MKKTDYNYRVVKLLEKLYEQISLEGFNNEDLQTFCIKFFLACYHEHIGLFAGLPVKSLFLLSGYQANVQLEETLRYVPPYCDYCFKSLSDATLALMKEISGLNWANIPVETIGMFYQLSMDSFQKKQQNAYFTTRKNIRRTVDELFVDKLEMRVNNAIETKDYAELLKIKKEISSIKILDASCGTGNYLIVIYEILYSLDAKICQALNTTITVSTEQMYGIEIDKTACELAKILLWTTNRMCEIKYASISRTPIPYLDVCMNFNIVNADALTIDWNDVISADQLTYIVGNPPFSFNHTTNMFTISRTDFSACWIKKSAEMMKLNPHIQASLLVSNSICQGEQVYYIWKSLLEKDGIVINFAHKDFLWEQALGDNVQVAVVIIGFGKLNRREKRLFYYENSTSNTPLRTENVNHINAYLENLPSVYLNGNFPFDKTRPKIYIYGEKISKTVSALEKQPNKFYKLSANAFKILDGVFEYVEVDEQPYNTDTIVIPRTTSINRNYFPLFFFENESVICNNSVMVIPNAKPYLFALLSTRLHKLWAETFGGRMLKLSLRYSRLVYETFPIPNLTKEQIDKLTEYAFLILNERKKINEPLGKMYLNMPTSLKFIHIELDSYVEQIYFGSEFFSNKQKLEKLVFMYNQATKNIPRQLIHYRTEFDYTIHELATYLNITDESYALAETKNRMSNDNLEKISKLYDIPFETMRKGIRQK